MSISSDPTGPESRAVPVEAPGPLSPSFGQGLVRPACHWLTERMGAATQSASPSIAGLDAEAGVPETELDDEGAAAIATLVALAAKIDAARSVAEPLSGDRDSEGVAHTMPRHIYDPLAAALGAAAVTNPAVVEDVPPTPIEVTATREPSQWGDALRSHYPEAGLLFVAVALLGIWAYASTPRTPETLPGPAVAEIRADEALPPAAPAADDARLKFVRRGSCSDRPCESLMTFTPDPEPAPAPRDEAGSSVSYTAAAQQEAGPVSAQVSEPSAPEGPAANAAQDASPAVASTAADAAPETEQIHAEPIATEPIKTEPAGSQPVLAAQEPPPATIALPADISVTMPSVPETDSGTVTAAPVESAAIVPEASPIQTLGVEVQEKSKSATKRPPPGTTAATARAPKAGPANRKTQPQAAKKGATAALSKSAPAKAALVKPTPKAPPADKQAVTAGAAANKAPGFPAATPSALFKPAPAPVSAAGKASEPAPASSFAPGDKPPGFEILTNLGGGFFALQPY